MGCRSRRSGLHLIPTTLRAALSTSADKEVDTSLLMFHKAGKTLLPDCNFQVLARHVRPFVELPEETSNLLMLLVASQHLAIIISELYSTFRGFRS